MKLESDNQKSREKKKKEKNSSTPHIATVTIKRKTDGLPYIKFIIEACDNGLLSSTEAMRYLDVGLDDLKKVELEILG